MKRGQVAGAVVAVLAVLAVVVSVATDDVRPVAAASPLAFEATFDTASDFYNRFDYGYSGLAMGQNGNPNLLVHGDHSTAVPCGDPSTFRNVTLTGTPQGLDFSQLFWWCAPSGDASSGHVMTGHDTTGYNIAWFSPHPYMTDVSKVCWAINETAMSRRKWTQVLFVSPADATRYPTGSATNAGGVPSTARGTGGFDLGYTAPDFRDNGGPSAGLFPQGGTLAGFRDIDGTASWFDHQDVWGSQNVGPGPPYLGDREQTSDKATRFKHCIENGAGNTIIYTKATPASGTVVRTLTGHIPQGQVKVVFEDDEYDGPKDSPAGGQPDGRYDPNVLTWHWDNIQVFAGQAPPPPTSTTAPTTTVAPTTTAPTTTTTAPTTTTSSTTTTVPPSTTTTIRPVPACPSGFTTAQRNWCLAVNAHIAALEAKVG
jgi:hypothetical protein